MYNMEHFDVDNKMINRFWSKKRTEKLRKQEK